MRPLHDTRGASASHRDLLAAAGCLSVEGPISTAAAAPANPIHAVALTGQTGTDIRSLPIHANGRRATDRLSCCCAN
jgi:hypothetical protein